MSSPVLRGGDMPVTETVIRDSVRQVLLPLWNVYYFFTLYANADGYEAKRRTNSPHLLDRYVLAKTRELVEQTTATLDDYEISVACAAVRSYLDALTNWYVRRSRDRFWAGDHDAFDTLYTVLETVSRVLAPLAPMVAEEIWRGVTGGRSVHLTDWPDAAAFPDDHELVASMDAVRDVCSAALSLRKARGLRVRLPLQTLTVASPVADEMREFARAHQRRGQRERRRVHRRRQRLLLAGAVAGAAQPRARGSAARCSRSSRRSAPVTGRSPVAP